MRLLALLLLILCSSTAAETLSGRVVGISDGDTLTLLVDREQVKVRLAQIDTPERGQPWANRARQELADLVFRQDVRVEVVDRDRYGRIVGQLWRGAVDVNRTLVAEGLAWAFRRYVTDPNLLEDEERARQAGRGLWSQPEPVPPWEWRRGARSAPAERAAAFRCGGKRYCRQMVSCAEARFYLTECGLTSLDGDGDGTPCETLCRL